MSSDTTSPLHQLSSPPRRTDSLPSTPSNSKSVSPIVQSTEDAKFARVVINTSITERDPDDMHLSGDERAQWHNDRERELTQMLERMTNWVEELATLLQHAYKGQTDLETALTLTRSNLQLALANNEMLEEALKRGTDGGKDVGWRRWSEREGVRRFGPGSDYAHERPNNVADVSSQPLAQQQTVSSRFFSLKTTLQRISSISDMSPTSLTHPASASMPSLLPSPNILSTRSPSPVLMHVARSTPPSRPSSPPVESLQGDTHLSTHLTHEAPRTPTAREKELTVLLDKERSALKAAATAKIQLEGELESLSQALFEEANKMVVQANRRLAETEEELRIATDQREALRSALRIVESENGALRSQVVAGDGRESCGLEGRNIEEEHDGGFYRTGGGANLSGIETQVQGQILTTNGGGLQDNAFVDNDVNSYSPHVHEGERDVQQLHHTPPFKAHPNGSALSSRELWPSPRLNTSFDIPAVMVVPPTGLTGSFWSPETPNSGPSLDANTWTEETSNQSRSGGHLK